MARTDPPYSLRMPIELRKKVEATAKKNIRSINAELVERIQRTFTEDSLKRRDDLIALQDKYKDLESKNDWLKRRDHLLTEDQIQSMLNKNLSILVSRVYESEKRIEELEKTVEVLKNPAG